MRTVTVSQRRRLLVQQHHLAGDADGPEAVTRSLVALHATDPASVYLSVLARSATTTLDDVATAMYGRRSLVRWMAMRRTLFVFLREEVPMVQSAVSSPLAAVLRRRLVSQLERAGTDPPVTGDVGLWLAGLEEAVEDALARSGAATGTQLATDVPGLATRIRALAPSDRPQNVTTSLLTIMSADGRLVRGTPTGAWTSRQHRWEPVVSWWPRGLAALEESVSQQALARRWLTRFGPATVEDLRWWTGWTQATTRRALARLPVQEVDLHGRRGIALPVDDAPCGEDGLDEPAPVAALLPALDPTPMGWKQRDWFLDVDPGSIFDRAGNIGPTLWWDGQVIGSWAVGSSGEIRTAMVADRGRDAHDAVDRAAGRLQARLGGTVVTPAVRTPLERALTADG